ncbi:AsmA family protein [Acidobacteria bacterium AB60]|nr:AsmA family protein [Acidobacteria bacterium AB60]
MRTGVKVLVAVVGVILVVLILVPFLVNGETFRPTLENRLTAALGRKVTLGHLSFSLFSGSLVASDIAIADDPAFGDSPFIQAKELKVGVELQPLIFNKELRITSLLIDTPSIRLVQNQAGKWNFSSIGGNNPTAPQKSSAPPELSVGELKITNGSAQVSSVPPTAKPFVYSGVGVDVKQFAFRNKFPFDLSANLPANGTLKLNGTAGPISEKDASQTPVHASLHIAHLDPVAAGIIEASKGVSTIADIDAQVDSNGTQLNSVGKIKAARLQLSRAGSPAPQPVDIDYKISSDLVSRSGKVSDIALHTGSVAAHVTGSYRMTPAAILLNLHLAAPNLPVEQLEELLPAVGVKIPSGSSLKGGTLTANLNISGPATETTLEGPVEIDNTKLAGFDLGSKIQGLNPFGGTGGGTDIQKLAAVVDSTPQVTKISNIDANIPQIGTATGAGTVSPSGELNFNLVATLSSNNAVGALANQAMNTARSQVQGLIGGFLHPGANSAPTPTNTARGIPLTVTGTTTNPVIRADIRANIKGLLK